MRCASAPRAGIESDPIGTSFSADGKEPADISAMQCPVGVNNQGTVADKLGISPLSPSLVDWNELAGGRSGGQVSRTPCIVELQVETWP
jgi:hypothetical protein